MPEARLPAADRRSFVALLRLVLSGPLALIDEGAAIAALRDSDGRRHAVPSAVLALALARGLVQSRDGLIAATAETRAVLRRLMAEANEDAFRLQHGDIEQKVVEVAGEAATVRIDTAESPLGAVARLKDRDGVPFLPPPALEAGERLAADFERAGLQPRVTQSWEPRLSTRGDGARGGQAEIADSAIAARRRIAAAIEAMGPELSGVALDICCFYKGLETVERERRWPARSAKLMLRTALLALARHYNPPPRRKDEHWGAADFRPLMETRA